MCMPEQVTGSDALRFRLRRNGRLYATGIKFTSGTVIYETAESFDTEMSIKPGDDGLALLMNELDGTDIEFEWVESDVDEIYEQADEPSNHGPGPSAD